MATIKNFEEIKAWQEARELAKYVYLLIKKPGFRADYDLRSQIRRAVGSILHNIAEGFDSGSNPEFVKFLRYARRSSSEVQSQLYMAMDQEYITEPEFRDAYYRAEKIKRQLNAFISYLRKTGKTS